MSVTPSRPGSTPDLQSLLDLFYSSSAELGTFEEVEVGQMPPYAQQLLAHDQHMTVTVEGFHDTPVDLEVLKTRADEDHYSRKILLRRRSDGRVVQFGIVRLRLNSLEAKVRQEIELKETPLGRVLIQHNVLRQVQLVSLWQIQPGPDLQKLFDLEQPQRVYGRTALIYCDGEPAVELLEIVTPVTDAP